MRTRLASLILVLLIHAGARAGTIYVTPIGSGGGTSWADATSLTNALIINRSNDVIWLAQGTYTATATFAIASNNVALYGGFTNGMATYGERNWTNYPAILDGQAANRRVVTVNGAGVTLDGLVISNSAGSSAGGIIKSTAGLLILANCSIVRNTNGPQNGVGAYFSGGAVVMMTNCTVAFNQTAQLTSSGHGIYASGVTLDMVDCLVNNQSPLNGFNERDGYGGALYFNNGTCRVVRTDFINNRKGDQGGGGAVYIGNTATLSFFSNCVFRGNMVAGGGGGALYVGAGSSYTVDVVNCTIAANSNTAQGAAIYLLSGTLNLKNSILWTNRLSSGNSASEIYQAGGTLRASYCTISGGQVLPYYYRVAGSASFVNCMTNDPLFASATDLHVQSPAGRWNGSSWVTTDTAYSPCVDAGDPSDSVGLEPTENGARRNLGAYGGTPQASMSPPPSVPQVQSLSPLINNYTQMILRGQLTNSAPVIATVGVCYGTNNILTDTTNGWQYVAQLYPPQQTGTIFTVTTTFLLTNTTYYYRTYATNGYGGSWSPVDSFTTVPTYPAGWGVGGGANVIHVKAGAVGLLDGSDWYNAYSTIAAGVAAVSGSRTNIWITGATYAEGAAFTLANAVRVIGGFAGTETAEAQRALTNALGVVTNYTVINGENGHAGFSITASGTVQLETLKCTNSPYSSGNGGINKSGSGLLVMNNCQLVNNGKGGYISAGSTLMTNCLVANNQDPGLANGTKGIGLYVSGASTILDLVDCLVTNNFPANAWNCRDGWGGAIDFEGRVFRAVRTLFVSNQGCEQGWGGGAVYIGNRTIFSNCVFLGNSAPKSTVGGALTVRCGSSTATVVNCTLAYNKTTSVGSGGLISNSGGAIYLSTGTLELKNCILWTNLSQTTVNEITIGGGAATASYCDFTGTNSPYVITNTYVMTWGSGIISADPLFAGATDLHLKSKGGRWDPAGGTWVYDSVTSPCLDAGDPADPVGAEPDWNGRRINLGAYGGTAQASRTLGSGLLMLIE